MKLFPGPKPKQHKTIQKKKKEKKKNKKKKNKMWNAFQPELYENKSNDNNNKPSKERLQYFRYKHSSMFCTQYNVIFQY